MEFLVSPYKGIGQIQLGQSIDEIRTLSPKWDNMPVSTDSFIDYLVDYCCQVEFENFEIVFIGISNPGIAKYGQINLLNLTFGEIRKMFASTDNNIYVEDGHSILYLDTGLCFYSDDMEDENTPQEVAIFRQGYYDDTLDLYKKC